MKDDWSEYCSTDLIVEGKNERCISLQEAVLGSSSLERLEKIKFDIDPTGMLNCNACLGNNKPRNKSPEENGYVSAEENGPAYVALGIVDTS
jgi:hypothetical protein